jgi:hypothetical protein
MDMTTQKQIRAAFWAQHPSAKRAPQNQCPADIRAAFVDFIDTLARDGRISDALASRATL